MIDMNRDMAEKKAVFLAALAETKYPNVGRAAKRARVGRQTVYSWRESDPEFRAAWDEIKEASLDDAEETVVLHGEKNVVAAFGYLRAHRENWREKAQLDVHAGGEITVKFVPVQAEEVLPSGGK